MADQVQEGFGDSLLQPDKTLANVAHESAIIRLIESIEQEAERIVLVQSHPVGLMEVPFHHPQLAGQKDRIVKYRDDSLFGPQGALLEVLIPRKRTAIETETRE